MLGDKRFLRSVRLRNLLSFGEASEEIELLSLNVLIGPNGCGKSNLIEAIDLLANCPRDILVPIRTGGGVSEWLWKGSKSTPVAEIDVTTGNPRDEQMALRHRLSFTMTGQRFELVDEAIENERKVSSSMADVYFYYRYQGGRPVLLSSKDVQQGTSPRTRRELHREDLAPDQSVLSQRRDPDAYPEITHLATQYGFCRLYREWEFGRDTAPRRPQKVDLPEDFLLPDASNLSLVLNDLEHRFAGRELLLGRLRQFYDGIVDFSTKIHGGTVQLFLHEAGLSQPIPANRLSDGTLRYLCLLSILCHPSPPPLVCIEEPEIGLHPDILPKVAELLVDASHRMQLVVTTHSDVLVDSLTSDPDAVLVCEKTEGATSMRRLERSALGEWLERYSLGELWRKGELGGNRW